MVAILPHDRYQRTLGKVASVTPAAAGRAIVLSLGLVLLAGACSSASPDHARTSVVTTTAAHPGTTPTTAATSASPAPPATTSPLDGLTTASEQSIGDPYYPELGNGGYDVSHYDVELAFDPATGILAAAVEIAATATADLDGFSLDFAGFEITAASVNGSSVEFSRQEEELILDLPTPLAAGETFTTTVTYMGEPAAELSAAVPLSVGWHTDSAGRSFTATEPDGAHWWFPGNDHPLDKATYRFELTAPDGFTAAATGTFIESYPAAAGGKTWVWEMARPMATYLAGVVIGELELVTDAEGSAEAGVNLRHALPAALAADPPQPIRRSGEMIAYLSQVFGPYPYDDFGVAIISDFPGAMENQTLSIFDDRLLGNDTIFELFIVHELAHHWYGNSVSPGLWQHIWLNEGFATYAEWLWVEREFGEGVRDELISEARAEVLDEPPPGVPPADDLFNPSVYLRGGLTLHALRQEVGDEAFFEILRAYTMAFAHGNAVTDDFIGVAEEVSGHDLGTLFNDWLYLPEVPPIGS